MARLVYFTLLLLLLASTAPRASCTFFEHLAAPVTYRIGTDIPITVNSLTSSRGLLPYNFYFVKTCRPDPRRMKDEHVHENLGEIILGNRISPSMYSVKVGENVTCREVCFVAYSSEEMNRLKKLINQHYRAHMFLDDIPLLERSGAGAANPRLRVGYRLGVPAAKNGSTTTIIHNYLNFKVSHRPLGNGEHMITGFYVTPSSVNVLTGCPDAAMAAEGSILPVTPETMDLKYFYSLSWELDTENADGFLSTRWDIYARAGNPSRKRGHLMAILNSLALLTFLGTIVMIILARTVRKDLLSYADASLAEENQEESGWKLVRGDVFRAPPGAFLLTALVSTGCQVVFMAGVVVLAAFLGVVHPTQRGNLLTSLIIFFCFSGSISGYVAGRMLKFFRKQSWKNGFTAVNLVPVCLLSTYLFANLISWAKHASTAIPFTTLLGVLFLWIAVPIPLSFLGLSTGFRSAVLSVPVKVSSIPRIVPEKNVGKRLLYVVGAGIIPFTAAFVEVVYILGSFWRGEPFHYFGYLAAILFVIVCICAEVAVVVTYTMLSDEDYQWWWVSFMTSAFSGFYFFFYSLVYLFAVLEIRQLLSIVLYCLYTMGVSVLLSVALGTLGFLASALFVRGIYDAIKAD
ncbi:endosomal integral membrane protein [Trypanosoma rangeli]|uniref:Transmembrane 9 superfamily member n=1 Tax=Trypanosoma rangeli TaxID=5698 RepID=A0A3R7MBZ3_TRYRA|nr:endosomal integral membrane protein [Trypanosoma rangeli]RNE99790.1 endosomal integral membrane protein [Trypanosoma rangeli]|eukprot:RNE99790.1 endosomal integral membrane protein [Trypanosoma rangeli]